MKTKFFTVNFIIITVLLISGAIVMTGKIFAEETTGLSAVQYPVRELGNCQDEEACKTYCDEPENMNACLDFAEKNNLMSEDELSQAKKFMEAAGAGPGGCQTKNACEEYCNDINHIDECIAFAEENNLIPAEELAEAKMVQAAIAQGIMPPACGSKKSCDVYCEEPAHMEECIAFGEAAGFIRGQELEDAKKMLSAVKKGATPPPCRGKKECDEYCGNPNNMEQCMTFAMEAGFMGEQEKADAQKMLAALKKGVRPPNCRGKEECDVYCSQDEHFEECLNFAEAAGFMSAEEAAMSRKTGGKGPGDCKTKEECEAFCNNPDNQETCFNFAKENGLIGQEDLKMMEEGKQKLQESLSQAPPQVMTCLEAALGAETIEQIKSGKAMPSQEIGDLIRKCFESIMPREEEGEGIPKMMQEGQIGPGGCKTPEECRDFCQANPEECKNFQPMPGIPGNGQNYPIPEGQFPQGPSDQGFPIGPNNCASPEECQNLGPNIPDGQTNEFPPPSSEQPPMENTFPFQNPPEFQQPEFQQPGFQQPEFQQPEFQEPPMNQAPPVEQPSPPNEPSPPASGFFRQNLFLGSVINIFLEILNQ